MEESNNGGGRTRCPSMFVKHDEVCDIVGTASRGKVFHHVVAPVNPVRIGKDQAHLLHSRT
jgi:hypothetical protein